MQGKHPEESLFAINRITVSVSLDQSSGYGSFVVTTCTDHMVQRILVKVGRCFGVGVPRFVCFRSKGCTAWFKNMVSAASPVQRCLESG